MDPNVSTARMNQIRPMPIVSCFLDGVVAVFVVVFVVVVVVVVVVVFVVVVVVFFQLL